MLDGSGLLNAKEFSKVCYDMGLFLEPVEVEAAMHLVDTAKDGYVIRERRFPRDRRRRKAERGGVH